MATLTAANIFVCMYFMVILNIANQVERKFV